MSRRRNEVTESEESKWAKALKTNAVWTKSELGDVVHWIRQVLGIICGIIWGLIPLTGAFGNMLFLAINALLPFVYYTKFLGVDDEEFGRSELFQEGFMSSFALFLVSWICTYNIVHVV